MRVDLLDYELPDGRIAQKPTEARDGARMLVVDPIGPREVTLEDSTIAELGARLPAGALLVVNDTRVLPARLFARKPETGGKVEIFLVRRESIVEPEASTSPDGEPIDPDLEPKSEIWRALGKASKPLRFEQELVVSDELTLRILGRAEDDGLLRVQLTSLRPIEEAIAAYGHVPLPPYIKRADDEEDGERYQTVFARASGAVAAPTAGLHLSRELLGRLAIAGFGFASVTLHVGLGTFQPVSVDDLDAHPMHEEAFVIDRAAADAIVEAKRAGRPVVAVGTTVVRALETAAQLAIDRGARELLSPCSGNTRLLLQPGAPLRVIDGLLTNFHLPRSTLLALVAALIGVPNLRAAYAHALAGEYRFFSYGDAMLIRRVLAADVVAEASRAEIDAPKSKDEAGVP